jgi:hypothetical protein
MVPTAPPGLFFGWPGWRKGRRKGLKIPREKSHVGSIPTPGTGCKVQQGRELGGFVWEAITPTTPTTSIPVFFSKARCPRESA